MLQHLLLLLLLLLLTALRMCNSLSQVLLHVILLFLLPQEGAVGVDGLHHLLRCGRSAAAVPRRQASGALAHFGPPIMGKQGEVAAHRFTWYLQAVIHPRHTLPEDVMEEPRRVVHFAARRQGSSPINMQQMHLEALNASE